MRTCWIAVALLAITRNSVAADVTASITTNGAACTYAAKSIASSIFRNAGITVDWQAPGAAGQPSCLNIELAERTPEDRLPGALAFSYPYGGCSRTITIFLDRIQSQTSDLNREAALLAYVLVHEIAHVIQGVDRHSEAGIMKARWSPDDRVAIFHRQLRFLDEDVVLMRRALLVGSSRRMPLTLIGRSESRTAFHPE